MRVFNFDPRFAFAVVSSSSSFFYLSCLSSYSCLREVGFTEREDDDFKTFTTNFLSIVLLNYENSRDALVRNLNNNLNCTNYEGRSFLAPN